MKHTTRLFLSLTFCVSLIFSSCFKDDCNLKRTYFRYDPVYMTTSDIRSSVKLNATHELNHPGKIYVYGSLLLVNEIKVGIHIFDNTDPAHPIKINFIEIPGNVDMSVHNNILYADNYIDLLSIDISDPTNPKIICRNENVFSPILVDPLNGILVDYIQNETTVEIPCNSEYYGREIYWEGDVIFSSNSSKRSGPNSTTSSFTGISGIGGSFAKFTATENFLYTIDLSHLYSFNVEQQCPVLNSKIQIGWNIETIFPYNNNLFIGSTSGMYIYTLINPATPTLAGKMEHFRSCDPVIVQDDIAYVTLHGGSACGGYTNQLDVVDVKDIFNPKLLKTYPLENPYGLAMLNQTLYICDKNLKAFDAKNIDDIHLIEQVTHLNPYDLIALENSSVIILVTEAGIFQYDASIPEHLKQLSSLLKQ